MNPKFIQIADYTYNLPDEKIAKHPLSNRDSSKLLVFKGGVIQEKKFADIANEIPENTQMVFNNTKVIQARLIFHKETGARIEIFCLEPLSPSDYSLVFQSTEKCSWKCIVGNLRKWKTGDLRMPFMYHEKEYFLTAKRIISIDGTQEVEFSWENPELCFSDILELTGRIPIPPYLNRETEADDLVRYQTVYSKLEGSVAAPTAGLHFTEDVFEGFEKRNISRQELTLHVGAGTFKPVKTEQIGEHDMHTEHIQVTVDSLKSIINSTDKIIPVGTTSVRTLESLYWMGVKMITQEGDFRIVKQWEAYSLENKYTYKQAYQAIVNYMEKEGLVMFNAATQIIIAPGYTFKVIDGLVTNFHQPKSTLLLLISALVGDKWHDIYDFALENNFRFLSYGDSSLLMKQD